MKKKFLFVVTLLFVCVFACCLASCEKEQASEPEKKLVLFLGDSIAEAFAGPSPLIERENYGYYGILGNINGYEYYNRAVSGYQTKHLYEFVQRADDGVNMVKSLVSTADIIHISIIGNDVLGYDITEMLIEAAKNEYTLIDKRLKIAEENIDKTIKYIKKANPEAVIILQTLYNPVGEDSPLVSERAKNALAEMQYSSKDYHKLAGRMITRMNAVLEEYLEKKTKKILGKVTYRPYFLVDVHDVFEDVYVRNNSRWKTLFCPDGIHPANEGHALIAGANQALLEKEGLASANALAEYKTLRKNQLDRLYKGIITVSTVKNEIDLCADFEDVTFAYFHATQDYTPYYQNTINYEGEHFDEDMRFDVAKLSIAGNNLTSFSLLGLKEVSPFNEEETYIKFFKDGRYEMKLSVADVFVAIIKLLISKYGTVNVSQMVGLDIRYLQNSYLTNMLPGFSYMDFEKSLAIVENAFGVSVEGIDFDKESVRKTANVLAETGEIVIDDPSILDSTVSLSWQGQYRLCEVKSKLTGETFTAIYINGGIDKSETYLRYTYDEQTSSVRLTVDVVNAVIEGKIHVEKENGAAK